MKLFVAIPAYDGKLTTSCFESLLKNTHILRDNGHEVAIFFAPGNPYLDAVRNICANQFLATDCDEMIFIDSDVGFENDAMLKLIKHDKEIVAGAYPYKQENRGFPVIIKFDENNNCKEEETGLVYADVVPTGFLRIKRSVFEKMKEHYTIPKSQENFYHFFATGFMFPDDPIWYGEDVYFSKMWTNMGGKIYIEPNINFVHTGFKDFHGNYHEYLMGRSVTKWQRSLDDQSDGINGWTSDKELALLGTLAKKSNSVIEVGSWKGRSTKVLLDNCKGTVYAVDHWKGTDSDMSVLAACGKDIYREFQDNVGHYKNLEVMRGNSLDMAAAFNGTKVDMVFIDADHTYEGVKADIEAWLPKCRKYICGHDYNILSVRKAVDEKFGKVEVEERMWWVEL